MNDDNRRNLSDKEEEEEGGDEDQIYQKEEPPSTEEVDKVEEEKEKGKKHENENESQNQSQSHIQQQESQTSQMQSQQDPNLTLKGGYKNVSEPLQEEQEDSGNDSLAQNLSLSGAKKETYAKEMMMRKSSSSQQSGESSSVPHFIQHQPQPQPLLHSQQQYASPSKREDNKKRTASQLSPPATGAKGSQVSKQIKLAATTTATAADNNKDLIKMQEEEEEETIILGDWNRALDAHIQKLALHMNVKKDQIMGEMTKIMQNTIAGISNQEEVVKAIRLEFTKARTDLDKACKQHQQTMDDKYQTYKSRLEKDRQLFRDEQEEKMNNLQQKMDKFYLDRKSMKTYQQEQEESIKARIKEALEMNQEMYNTSEDNFQAMLKEDEDSIKHFLKEEEDQKKETRLRISRTKKIKDLQQQVGSKKTKRGGGRGDRKKKSVLSLSSSSAFHELTTEIEKHYADLENHIQGRVKQLSHKVLECENLTHDINIDDKRIRNASSDHKTTFEDIKTQVKDLSAQFRRLQEVQSDLHVQQAELEEQITRKQQILKEERTNTQALMTQQIEQCRIDTLHVKLELTELQNGVADLTKRYSSLNEHLNYLANQDLPHLDSVLRDTTAEQKHRLKTIEQNMEATQYALNNDRITQEQIKREIDTYFVRTFPEVWEEKRRILAHLTSDNNHVLMDDFVKLYDQKEENIKAFWSSKVEEAAANNKGGFGGASGSGGESQKNKMIMPPPQQQQQQQHKLFTAPFSSTFSPLRDNSHFGWEPSPISDRHSSFTNKKMLPLAAAAEEETTPTTAGFRIGSGGGGIDMNQGGRGTSSETVMGLGRGTSAGSAVGGRGRGGFDAFGSGLESRGSASIFTNQQAFGERGVGVGGGAAGSDTIISSTDKDSKQEKLSKQQQQQQPLSSDDPVSSTSNLKTSTTKRNFINHALISKNAAIYTGELPHHKQLQESTKKGK